MDKLKNLFTTLIQIKEVLEDKVNLREEFGYKLSLVKTYWLLYDLDSLILTYKSNINLLKEVEIATYASRMIVATISSLSPQVEEAKSLLVNIEKEYSNTKKLVTEHEIDIEQKIAWLEENLAELKSNLDF